MSNINQIWLAPICHEDGDGRLWCQDDVWGDDCGCGIAQHSAVRYVLASDYDKLACLVDPGHKLTMDAACGEIAALEAERDALRAQVEAMRAALCKFTSLGIVSCNWDEMDDALRHANAALQAKP